MNNFKKAVSLLIFVSLLSFAFFVLSGCAGSAASAGDLYSSSSNSDDYEDEYEEEYEDEYEEYEDEYYEEEYEGPTYNGITNDEIWYYLDQIGYYYGTDDPFSVDDYVGEDYIETYDGESWETNIWWVDSSAFDQIGYNFYLDILDVQFDSSGWYRYYDIEPEMFVEFITSESKGKYYNEYIKGRFECDRLD